MLKFCLVGNPNTGKTTFFNTLTKSHEHVGNWQGVTVDKKSKTIMFEKKECLVIDLPGTYSLVPLSKDEQITNDYLKENSCKILNIIDKSNLERNLYLSLQLLEMGYEVINVLNETVKNNKLDIEKFNKNSCFCGVEVKANDKESVFNSLKTKFISAKIPYREDKLIKKIEKYFSKQDSPFLCAVKFLEKDTLFLESLKIDKKTLEILEEIVEKIDSLNYIASLRYEYINSVLKQCFVVEKIFAKHKIDNLFLNKFLALPIFVALFALVFYLTFSSFGLMLSEFLKSIITFSFSPLINWLDKVAPYFICDMVSTAIIGGIGAIASFLPQIIILYIFLNILEESGYMSRVAFMFEDVLGKIGLNGKSIFCFLMGYGCATTTIMTTRNLEENSRIKTAMSVPLISCSAKLPLFIVLSSVFFKGNILLIISLYFACLFMAISFAWFLNLFYKQKSNFILEFAPLRKVSVLKIVKNVFKTCKEFLVRIGLLLIALSVLVWFLQNFSFGLRYVGLTNQKSILQTISESLSFLFIPLGLNNWGIVASLLSGFIAKEMIVSTLAIVNAIPMGTDISKALEISLISENSVVSFNISTAFIFMLFCLTYVPCVATLAMLKKEIGWKKTIFSCTLQIVFTYLVCALVFLFINLFSIFGLNVLWWTFGAVALILSVLFIFFRKTKCRGCNGRSCKNCSS